jgi:hypothetical protein
LLCLRGRWLFDRGVKTFVTPKPLFWDFEFQVDGFYTQFFGGSGTHFHTGTGGGIGLNFFFHYFGVGYEAAWYDNGGITAHMPSAGNFFLRDSICIWHLAPYAMVVGGGGAWNPDGIGYGNVASTAEEATDRGIVLADFPRVSMEKQSGGVSANWRLAMGCAIHGEPQ